MTDPIEPYREQLAQAEDMIVRGEASVDGFAMTARFEEDGEGQLRCIMGSHPHRENPELVELLGHTLLSMAARSGTHPAVLAHGAVSYALDNQDRIEME